MTKKALLGFRVLLLAIIISSCGNMNFDLPYGPKGPRGRTAYDVWKEQVNKGQIDWPKDQVEVSDYIIYIKGPKGDKGDDGLSAYETWKAFIKDNDVPNPHVPGETWKKDRNSQSDFWDFLTGRDGKTPYVGENKNWWIGTTDTGVYAYGTIGTDGLSAYDRWLVDVEAGTAIDNSGNVWPKTKKSLDDFFTYWKGKDGRLGLTPKIGSDGNWWIGETNTNVPAKGQDGKSAYELWAKDVKEEKVQDNHGKTWPKDKFSKEEYWKYLHGDKGPKGDSAYELWKVEVEKGNVEVPGKPGEKWPASDNSISHFWKYLTGPGGKNGLSAYDLWKKELIEKFGTSEQLLYHKTGLPWPKEKSSIDDFWEYTRGRDGNDGADGKPGEPGTAGNLVEIIKGKPNVIAQYSQQEYGEYVDVFSGAAKFKVYDENGAIAPYAKVEGMPGLPETEVFTADEKGEFVIPRDKLPWKEKIQEHWGIVKKVTIKGVAKESASNTYVPNQVQLKLVLDEEVLQEMTSYYKLKFRILRKIDPDREWEDLPSYLPELTNIEFMGVRVSDRLNPTTTNSSVDDVANDLYPGTVFNRKVSSFEVRIQRYCMENPVKYMNGLKVFWDKQDNYATVAQKTRYYGTRVVWDGYVEMVPYQLGPVLKSIKLRKFDESTQMFLAVEGVYDYSVMDFTKIYNIKLEFDDVASGAGRTVKRLYPTAYSEVEARKIRYGYILARYNVHPVDMISTSQGMPSGPEQINFSMNTVRLGSMLRSQTSHWSRHGEYNIGKIVKNGIGEYVFEKAYSALPDITVTYQDN